jgi:predicted O-methyltransferase YrrM
MSQYNTNFLHPFNETTLGPIQGDEALFLYSLCQMVKPQVVLEVGCLIGQSLRVWINAGVSFIYAVDAKISDAVKELQRGQGTNGMLCFEQDMKQPIDFIRGIPDLVFVDASHKLEDNIAVVQNLLPVLKPGALVIFHDTGHWNEKDMTEHRREFIRNFGGYKDEETGLYIHHPGEKSTIKWISENTNWQRIDFWTTEVARYGMTIFQVPN